MQDLENAYLILARQFQRAIDNGDIVALRDTASLMDLYRLTFVEIDEDSGRKISKPVTVYAAEHASTEVMGFLLEEGCDINARDSFGNTPLMIAVAEERMDMITFLIRQPEIQTDVQNYYGETIASIARLNNNENIINYLKTWSPITDIDGKPVPEFVEMNTGKGKLII